jgi:hypothetical protein
MTFIMMRETRAERRGGTLKRIANAAKTIQTGMHAPKPARAKAVRRVQTINGAPKNPKINAKTPQPIAARQQCVASIPYRFMKILSLGPKSVFS